MALSFECFKLQNIMTPSLKDPQDLTYFSPLVCPQAVRTEWTRAGTKSAFLSRLPPKSAPLLVRAAFGGRRHRSTSHRRSTCHCSICFVLFPRTPGLHSLITLLICSLCFPHVFVCNCFVTCFVLRARLVFPRVPCLTQSMFNC